MNVDQIASELADIKHEIQLYAEAYGMPADAFLDSLDRVESYAAEAMIPLLVRKIELLKLRWKFEVGADEENKLLLFSKTR